MDTWKWDTSARHCRGQSLAVAAQHGEPLRAPAAPPAQPWRLLSSQAAAPLQHLSAAGRLRKPQPLLQAWHAGWQLQRALCNSGCRHQRWSSAGTAAPSQRGQLWLQASPRLPSEQRPAAPRLLRSPQALLPELALQAPVCVARHLQEGPLLKAHSARLHRGAAELLAMPRQQRERCRRACAARLPL